MRSLHIGAYLFAVAAIAITALLTLGPDGKGISVGVLGETLAVTPYVIVRAIEEQMKESLASSGS